MKIVDPSSFSKHHSNTPDISPRMDDQNRPLYDCQKWRVVAAGCYWYLRCHWDHSNWHKSQLIGGHFDNIACDGLIDSKKGVPTPDPHLLMYNHAFHNQYHLTGHHQLILMGPNLDSCH